MGDRKACGPSHTLTVPFDRTDHSTAVALSTTPFYSFDFFLFRCHFEEQLWPTGPCPLSPTSIYFCVGGTPEQNMPCWEGARTRLRQEASLQCCCMPGPKLELVLFMTWTQQFVFCILSLYWAASGRPPVTWRPGLSASIDASSTVPGKWCFFNMSSHLDLSVMSLCLVSQILAEHELAVYSSIFLLVNEKSLSSIWTLGQCLQEFRNKLLYRYYVKLSFFVLFPSLTLFFSSNPNLQPLTMCMHTQDEKSKVS